MYAVLSTVKLRLDLTGRKHINMSQIITKEKAAPYQKRRKESRKLNKQWAVEYKGGKCEYCGFVSSYLDVYEFHHLDMNEKEFTISIRGELLPESFQKKVKPELDKCSLLCANCHRLEHAKWKEQRIKND